MSDWILFHMPVMAGIIVQLLSAMTSASSNRAHICSGGSFSVMAFQS